MRRKETVIIDGKIDRNRINDCAEKKDLKKVKRKDNNGTKERKIKRKMY